MIRDKKIVLLLDGEEPLASQLQDRVAGASLVIATDGAAEYAMRHGIKTDIIIGDMDSITEETRTYFTGKGTAMIEDPDQMTNDFEKALLYLTKDYAGSSVLVLGIHGKRTDHLLANFSVMLRFTNTFRIEALDAFQRHVFLTELHNTISIANPIGTTVTLLAFSRTEGISTSGLLYPLRNAEMQFGKQEGLSNIVSDAGAQVTIRSGALLVSISE